MKKLLILLLMFVSLSLQAAPFIVSDDTTQNVTHCGITLDSTPKVDVPVTATKACKFDVGNVTVGVHTIKASYVLLIPGWGRSESVDSAPFTFTKPSPTISNEPSGLVITP